MNLGIAVGAVGGLALFLLAMLMMTEGLTTFAGTGLKRLLGRWTSTPLRGVAVGILVTGLVQSSSAVTVATIGFVNAGVLTLRQALGVIFGTNVGTTMTGWLVSLVGFGFRIEAFALPILSAGVGLRLVAPSRRWKGLGEALAGFGLFFLGLSILKDAFGGFAASYGAGVTGGGVASAWPSFVLVGFVATVLTQSSSAAIAIILTAAAGGVATLESSAAAVIGANLGTTSTAAMAVLKATPAAKRLALGHIAFNVLTGLVALSLLPLLLRVIAILSHGFDAPESPAVVLAIFHTIFNALGVALMLPLVGTLGKLLERFFRSAEEDIGRPQHIDVTLVATPALAVSALREDLGRMSDIVGEIARSALSDPSETPELEGRVTAVRTLGEAIADFVAAVRSEGMPRDVAAELAGALYAARHFQQAARLAPGARLLGQARQLAAAPAALIRRFVDAAAACLPPRAGETGETSGPDEAPREVALEALRSEHREARTALLDSAVKGLLSVEATDGMLDAMDATRRMVKQLVKAERLLRDAKRSDSIESEEDAAA
jgi:phosphate:Na+ symporter